MMRKLFWALLLINVFLFAAIQRGWLERTDTEQQPQPPLHEEMIRLVATPQQGLSARMPPAQTRMTAPESAPVEVAPPLKQQPLASSVPGQEKSSVNSLSCLEWGEFSGPDLLRATTSLSVLQLGDKLSKRMVERDIGYWVYIPPLKNKTAINRKVAELKAQGIKEYFVVQSADRWRNAISLGVFKTREAAQNFLNHVRTKGVHAAQVGERTSKIKTTIFRFVGVDAVLAAKLASIQKDFSGSELKNVPCAH